MKALTRSCGPVVAFMLLLVARPVSGQPAVAPPGATKIAENDMVVVWETAWVKGKPTASWERRFDQLVVTLEEGAIRVSRPDKSTMVEQLKVGGVRFESKGTVSSEEGLSERPARAVIVAFKSYTPPSLDPKVAQQLKDAKAKGIPGQLPRKGAVQLFENEHFSVWDNAWPLGPPQDEHVHYKYAVCVFIQAGTIISTSAGSEGQPGPGVERAVGYVNVGSPRGGPHSEGASKGAPRAIFVEFK